MMQFFNKYLGYFNILCTISEQLTRTIFSLGNGPQRMLIITDSSKIPKCFIVVAELTILCRALFKEMLQLFVDGFEDDEHDGATWAKPHDFRQKTLVQCKEPLFPVDHSNASQCRPVLDNAGHRLRTLDATFGDVKRNVGNGRQRTGAEANCQTLSDVSVVTLLCRHNLPHVVVETEVNHVEDAVARHRCCQTLVESLQTKPVRPNYRSRLRYC